MHRLLAMLVGLTLVASAATAATIRGTARGERLVGTARADAIFGVAGADTVYGRGGADFVDPGDGADVVDGGDGADRLSLETDGIADRASCGRGRDIVTLDERDVPARDCEVTTRRLSRDLFRGGTGQHATQAEPDSYAWDSTVVTVFQIARNTDGGAMDIGFATSRDGGSRWRSGRLPGVGVNSVPAGAAPRVSDPVVAFDPLHGVWLAATLAVSPGLTQLLVSRSLDGLAWDLPVVAATSSAAGLAFDKEWLVCDTWPASPFFGRCYLSYTLAQRGQLATQVSGDGGLSWGAAAIVPPTTARGAVGVQPVVRPDGLLVLVYLDNRNLVASRSADGGQTFATPITVASISARRVTGMRAYPLPSADTASDGTVYVAWHDCQLRQGCAGNDIVIATSRDGVAWSSPRRLPVVAADSQVELFIPGLAVDPASGPAHHLAVVYHALPNAPCSPPSCQVDVRYAESDDGGRTWKARSLISRPMRLGWIANTEQGRMLGDYVSVTLAAGRAVPVFALASPPVQRQFRQAIFATTTLR